MNPERMALFVLQWKWAPTDDSERGCSPVTQDAVPHSGPRLPSGVEAVGRPRGHLADAVVK